MGKKRQKEKKEGWWIDREEEKKREKRERRPESGRERERQQFYGNVHTRRERQGALMLVSNPYVRYEVFLYRNSDASSEWLTGGWWSTRSSQSSGSGMLTGSDHFHNWFKLEEADCLGFPAGQQVGGQWEWSVVSACHGRNYFCWLHSLRG